MFLFRFFCIVFFGCSTTLALANSTLVTTISEFDSAVENANPGDTIKLGNGVWMNSVLEFYANGEEGNPIVLTAESPGKVILSGTSRLEIYGEYLVARDLDFANGASSSSAIVEFRKSSSELAENCRLTNCRIIDYNPVSDDTDYKWVSIYGKNNRVDHCNFEGKNNEGALLVVWLNGSPNYHQIDHNYFADIPELGRNGGETIRIGTSTNSMTESRTIVEYNLFESCDGEIEIISNKSGFNVYRYNTFRDNDGTLTLRHGNDCDVYGNFFFGHPDKNSGGVRIIGERHKVYNNYFQDLEGEGFRAAISMVNGVPDSPLNRYFQVKNAEVVHNTIVSCEEPFAIGEGNDSERTLPPIDCIVANNVVDKTTGSASVIYTDTPVNISYESNYIFDTNVGITDDGVINSDPGLVLTDDIWRPNASSAIKDASSSSFSYVELDMDGQSRDNSPDIGSDEVSETDIVIFPLTKDDVGYVWEETEEEEEEEEETLQVFNGENSHPILNSNGGVLTIHNIPLEELPVQLIIYNLQGKKIASKLLTQDNYQTSISNHNGVFIVKLVSVSEEYVFSRKVLL